MATPGATATGNSYLDTFKRCRRKFYYRHIRGLRAKGVSMPLTVGTLTHEGLAVLSEGGLEAALDKIEQLWYGTPGIGTEAVEGMNVGYTDNDPFDLAVKLLTDYVNIYPNDPFTPLVEEHEFSFNIGKFQYTGKCDGIVSGPDKNLYVMEHKTTGLAISMYLRTFYLNPQITGYYIGAQQAVKGLGGKGLSGIILNVIQKPRKLKSGWSKTTFGREVFTRTAQDIEEFLSSTEQVFKAIEKCKDESTWVVHNEKVGKEAYYRCEHECFSFNRACEYIELCRYGENESYIEEMFNVEGPTT